MPKEHATIHIDKQTEEQVDLTCSRFLVLGEGPDIDGMEVHTNMSAPDILWWIEQLRMTLLLKTTDVES